jgi:hypothetical protein
MKFSKLIPLILVAMLSLTFPPFAKADSWGVHWFDDFEKDLSKWTIVTPKFEQSTDYKIEGNYSGKLYRETSNTPIAYMLFPVLNDMVKIDYYALIYDHGYLGSGEGFYTNVLMGSTQCVYLCWHNNHNIYWYNGVSTVDTGLDWRDQSWHHGEIIIDILHSHIEFWLDGVNATSMGFQNVPSKLDRFQLSGYVYDAYPKLYIDLVQIMIPYEAPPEIIRTHRQDNYPALFFGGFSIFIAIILLMKRGR